MSEVKKNKYKCIDLFAGIGGIRLGFEEVFGVENIETVFVSEYDANAVKTYTSNFNTPLKKIEGIDDLLMTVDNAVDEKEGTPKKALVYGDITKIDSEALNRIPSFDICLAGFPCQAFSLAGKRLGFEDSYKGMARGTLFRELIKVCETNKPKVVFCENVKGLLHHDGGQTFKVIDGAFQEAGYRALPKVLNSAYFGVPQNRERVYIVAFREDVFPEDFVFPEGKLTERRIKDVLDDAPVDSRYYLSKQYLETLRKHRKRHEEKGNGFGYQIRELDSLASTLSCGGMGRERNLIKDARPHSMEPMTNIRGPINDENVRKMTPREWARLQGFSDDFVLPVSDTQLYKQFGNTVSIPVISAIASKILEVLDDYYSTHKNIDQIRKKILKELRQMPLTRKELLEKVSPFFLADMPERKRAEKVSAILQELKRKGFIRPEGNTASALWHYVDE